MRLLPAHHLGNVKGYHLQRLVRINSDYSTFNAHTRCEMKLAPNCSGIRGKIDSRKQRSVSDPYQRSMSNFSRAASISMMGMPRYELQSIYEEQPKSKIERIMEPLRVEHIEEIIPSIPPTPTHLKSMSISDASEVGYNTLQREKSFQTRTPTLSRISPSPGLCADLIVGSAAEVIYDYFATHPEEANIHEGEHVRVERLDDGSGWTLVSKSGITGIVPTSYIKGLVARESFSTLRQNSQILDHGMVKVLYTFTRSDSSELSVTEGAAIRVIKEDDGSGWILATDGKTQGLLPANYVKPLH
jgi:formin-binding protein 1